MMGPERSKRIGFRAASVDCASSGERARQQGQCDRASAWTVTCSASVASLPQLRASSRSIRTRRREMGHVGHDLHRETMSTDAVVVELGLHAGLVDEVLRVPPPSTTDAVLG